MSSYVPPKKNAAFVAYIALEDQANAGLFKTSPTIASGDFRVSIDGGALANLTTLPTNTPSGSAMVKISLSADEMNGDNITVVCTDAAGDEWYDLVLNIQTSAAQIDDLATPTNITAGTITTVTNLTNAPTSGDLTATMKSSVAAAILETPANLLATDGDGAVVASSANVTMQNGVAVAPADANGNVPVDVQTWRAEPPEYLLYGLVKSSTELFSESAKLDLQKIASFSIVSSSGNNLIVSSTDDMNDYLLGAVVAIEYEVAAP